MERQPEQCGIILGRAQADLSPVPVAQGVWSLCAVHRPPTGGKLINRCMLYEVEHPGETKSLVVLNGITPDLERDEPFGAIRRLAKERGASVDYIFNPGPEHHLSLAHYARAFPEARVLVAAGRIEREAPELCALDNVEAMAPGDALPELARAGLHVHVWDGLMEGRFPNTVQGRFFVPRGTAEPTLFFHERSKTLLNGGHGWWYWGRESAVPWLARKLLGMRQGEVVWSPRHYFVWDRDRCAASARRVVEWDFEQLLDLHVPLDDWLMVGAKEAVDGLCRPIAEGRWDDVPLRHDTLQIPEGTPKN